MDWLTDHNKYGWWVLRPGGRGDHKVEPTHVDIGQGYRPCESSVVKPAESESNAHLSVETELNWCHTVSSLNNKCRYFGMSDFLRCGHLKWNWGQFRESFLASGIWSCFTIQAFSSPRPKTFFISPIFFFHTPKIDLKTFFTIVSLTRLCSWLARRNWNTT